MWFTKRQIDLAVQLKALGLPWSPGVGQYAYDVEHVIQPTSPFQPHVYYFLDFPCFVEYFGSYERLAAAMVWLPTCEDVTRSGVEVEINEGHVGR